MNTKRLLATAAVLALAQAANAAIIYTQNFESLTSGAINNAASANDLQGQSGFTAPTRTDVVNTGLGYSNGAITIAAGSKGGYSTQNVATSAYLFSNTMTAQTGTVYFSVVWSWTGSDAVGETFAFLLSGQTTLPGTPDLRSAGGVRINNNNQTGPLQTGSNPNNANIHTRDSGGAGVVSVTGPVANTQGSANLLVGKISKSGGNGGAYDQVSIWLNPSTTTEGAASLTVNQTISATSLDKFYMWSAANSNTAQVFNFDNIVIGTSYADVVGASAIPEPSAFAAFAGLAGLGLALSRRRRS